MMRIYNLFGIFGEDILSTNSWHSLSRLINNYFV